jgi:hypothetical protein
MAAENSGALMECVPRYLMNFYRRHGEGVQRHELVGQDTPGIMQGIADFLNYAAGPEKNQSTYQVQDYKVPLLTHGNHEKPGLLPLVCRSRLLLLTEVAPLFPGRVNFPKGFE